MSTSSPVGFVWSDRYLQHNPGLYVLWSNGGPIPFVEPEIHPSNYRLAMRTKHLVDMSGLGKDLMWIDPYPATEDDLTVYHTPEYVQRVREICESGGGETGEGAPASPESWEVALLAAGGGMAGVDAVMEGRARRVFVNVRPPGHHAMSDKGMGFCIFNNVVVAARHAQRKHGIERVMVLDWDVHDGNGTQDAFYADGSVLFFSFHQDQLYPTGWGEVQQTGEGAGEGFTVNVPLPAGSGDAAYLAAMEEIVRPIADEFQPQLVLVSAGQDASTMDPLGRMCVTTEGYRRMTQAMIDIAETHAEGRLVILQEGGYSELYAPYCTMAIVETLAGRRMNLPEPLDVASLQAQPQYSTVGLSAEAAITAVKAQQAANWSGLRG